VSGHCAGCTAAAPGEALQTTVLVYRAISCGRGHRTRTRPFRRCLPFEAQMTRLGRSFALNMCWFLSEDHLARRRHWHSAGSYV